MRRVHVGAALDYVFGYTVCNAPRATFSSESQWTRGKSFDTFCPLGPVVVTADELRAFCSRTFTLEPGDLLLTGTPWGCGYFMDPPALLSSATSWSARSSASACCATPSPPLANGRSADP